MTWAKILSLFAAAVGVGSFAEAPSCADSWPALAETTVNSCSGSARAIVSPGDIERQIVDLEAKPNVGTSGNRPVKPEWRASARVERLEDGVWQRVWEAPLVNEAAPVDVLVRDDGSWFVTLDDWYAQGYGPNAVVIYGPAGAPRHRLALSDIVPRWYVETLSHSTSLIQWRRTAAFSRDGQSLLLPVATPTHDNRPSELTVMLKLDLYDGSVAPIDRAAWNRALALGRNIRAEQIEAEKAAKAAFAAPLVAPTNGDRSQWEYYLREAVARRIGDGASPSEEYLPAANAADFAQAVSRLRETLAAEYSKNVAAGSAEQGVLAPALQGIAQSFPVGSLKRIRFYVAARDDEWPAIVRAMAGTGATLIRLDPAIPIPQRPERIARRFGA